LAHFMPMASRMSKNFWTVCLSPLIGLPRGPVSLIALIGLSRDSNAARGAALYGVPSPFICSALGINKMGAAHQASGI
jgi:hypothetical protein